jgi:SAM-dependent methyltransferase
MTRQIKDASRITFICPQCREVVVKEEKGWGCRTCNRFFEVSPHGSPNFLIGPGFTEDENFERDLHEEKTARVTVEGYLLPLLKRTFPDVPSSAITVLDVGCGVGMYVDLLREAGYNAWGIDAGRHRPKLWSRRIHPGRLVVADGDAMPFPDGSFDFLFCAGVIEHVGCDGDARTPSPGYEEARMRFAKDNVRVVKKDRYLNYTCPNRHFPFDLWHRNTEDNPFRFHWPWDPFLFTLGDFRRLFVHQCGCTGVSALPIRGYWGFLRLNEKLWQRLGCQAAKIWFETVGSWPLLRGSFANPWLSVLVQK